MGTTKASRSIISSIKILFLAAVSLLLFYLTLPNPQFSFPPLILFCFTPFFLINYKVSGIKLWLINFFFFSLIFLMIIIPNPFLKQAFCPNDLAIAGFILALMGLSYASFLTLASSLTKKNSIKFRFAIFAAGWTGAEFFLSFVPWAFPFPLASVLTSFPAFLQSANLCGAYLITFLIVATNTLIAELFSCPKERKWKIILIILILHVINLGYGIYCLNSASNNWEAVKIALIQPNISYNDTLFSLSKIFEKSVHNHLLKLSATAQRNQPQLIIWPELSENYLLDKRANLIKLHLQITSQGSELLIGTNLVDHKKTQKIYNVACLLTKDGQTALPYYKRKLFPFSESDFYATGGKSLPILSSTPLNRLGTMICLESLYPQIARNLVKTGAQILILLSNDNSFGDSILPRLHGNLMILRSIENNRFGIHISNNGPSLVADNTGRIMGKLDYGKCDFLECRVLPVSQQSVYTKTGDWFVILCLIYLAALLLLKPAAELKVAAPGLGGSSVSCAET